MSKVDDVMAALDGVAADPGVEYREQSSRTAELYAEQNGLAVIYPEKDELFIDIDGQQALDHFNQWLPRIHRYISFTHEVKPSPSGEEGHFHIYCKLGRTVSDDERLVIQMLLGSDMVREYYSWGRTCMGDPTPTCFFEKKEDVELKEGLWKRIVKSLTN